MMRYAALLLIALFLSSCATRPIVRPAAVSGPVAPGVVQLPQPVMPRQDIFHIVAPGESFWRIGKMYDVPGQDIARANRLSMNSVLHKGDRLRIPNAAPVQPVISLYPSKRWKYIIIHHSATDEGDSLLFDKAHLQRGWDGVGYHFVIDNGTKGRVDGQIEVSPRWLKQLPGAHCKADDMNERSIGICLVGNFNEGLPSNKQMDALIELVNKLRLYYNIPIERIMGHGQVHGAKTDCPGKRFLWDDFRRRLRKQQAE